MENEDNLNFDDMMLGRVVQQKQKISMSNIEKSYIADIFKEDFYLSEHYPNIDKVIESIKSLDRNFFYDIYKFTYDDITYAIKIGSEDDIEIFEKEAEALNLLEGKNLAPQVHSINKLQNYSYLLTSFEHGFSAQTVGLSTLLDNVDLFAKTLAKLHNETKTEENQRDYFLESYYSLGSFEEILDPEVYKSLMKNSLFVSCLSLLKDIEESISIQMPSAPEKYSSLCHTHLIQSNILFRADFKEIKFCNFYNSFILSPLWDLAFLSIKLNLQSMPSREKVFLDAYFKESYLEQEDFSMIFYKQVCYKIILYKIVSMYFLKMVIPEDSGSIIDMFKNYGYIRNMVNDEFPEYIDTLDKMFGNFTKLI
jgi:hypothetical protein